MYIYGVHVQMTYIFHIITCSHDTWVQLKDNKGVAISHNLATTSDQSYPTPYFLTAPLKPSISQPISLTVLRYQPYFNLPVATTLYYMYAITIIESYTYLQNTISSFPASQRSFVFTEEPMTVWVLDRQSTDTHILSIVHYTHILLSDNDRKQSTDCSMGINTGRTLSSSPAASVKT